MSAASRPRARLPLRGTGVLCASSRTEPTLTQPTTGTVGLEGMLALGVKWLVAVVVVYTAARLLRAAKREGAQPVDHVSSS